MHRVPVTNKKSERCDGAVMEPALLKVVDVFLYCIYNLREHLLKKKG